MNELGWIFGALAIGLWWGEFQRRRSVERHLTFGSPTANLHRPTSVRPTKEAEDRFQEFAESVSEDTVQRTADGMMREAAARGIEGYSVEQATKDARAMLAGQSVEAPVV
jgi:hypothetical protein